MQFKRIYVEITNRCNLACSFCSKTNRPLKKMSLEEFSKVIEKIKPYTKTIYLHVKGEPLLHPELDSILSICDQEMINVNITTNGTLLKERKEILLKHPCLSHLYISLHSENRKENYLEEVFSVTHDLSKKMTVIFRYWTLKDGEMNKEFEHILEKMKHYYNLSNDLMEELKTQKNVLIAENCYFDKADVFDWPTLELDNLSDGYCLGGKSHIAILSDGTCVPCCLDAEGVINLGNIFSSSLEEILSSSTYQKLRSGFERRKPYPELCRKCTYKNRF